MYIKIKHLRYFLLISICVFFAGFNYLAYVKADNSTSTTQTSCNKSVDSDCDGLTDAEEKLYGTNPNNPDSDGDGYSDGVEIKSGYDPLKPAPGDRITAQTDGTSTTTVTDSTAAITLTDQYIQDFKQFVASKNGQEISVNDINTFTDAEMTGEIGAISITDLPAIDRSEVKILPQTYESLSESDKKQRIQQDAVQYLYQIIYLLSSNAPSPVTTTEELQAFQSDLENRLADVTNSDNVAYFSDMGNRLEVFSQQLDNLQVPETMVDLHIKFARIVKGFLSLRDMPSSNTADPMGNIVTLNKASKLALLFSDFLTTDFSNYFKQISAS